MPITQDEFRQLLADRGRLPDNPQRLTQVHRRISRDRRRRRAGLAVAAAAVLATAAGVPVLLVGQRSSPATVYTSRPGRSLPRYAMGAQLLAGTAIRTKAHGRASFTFTPTSWELILVGTCPSSWPAGSTLAYTVDGHLLGGSCGGAVGPSPGQGQRFWSALGVRLDRASTLTVTVVGTAHESFTSGEALPPVQPASQRPAATVTVGVYQRVPAVDYPLPSAPATLAPLPSPAAGAPSLDSRVVGADGTWKLPVTIAPSTVLDVHTVAPGQVRVWVGSTLIDDTETWDYHGHTGGTKLNPTALAAYGVRATDGQTITLTVRAARFSVPGWTVDASTYP